MAQAAALCFSRDSEDKRREIIEEHMEEICDHENAGCFGDAENARKWMEHRLRWLDEEYGMERR